jgi:hypothetical protein
MSEIVRAKLDVPTLVIEPCGGILLRRFISHEVHQAL